MENLNLDNLADVNEELQQVYLDRDMVKTEAEEELKITKASFKDFMQRYEQDPQNLHKGLKQCEIDFLKHFDPDLRVDEEVFYSRRRSNKPTMEEYRAASGYRN